ncbi:MAG: methylenetetrahydromethanopterin dehydrogenase [Thermoleophilia bacterium]|nr:methylenetetrahydromethanopterin dehydrogenase [Thermoleophilia bacterium]
MKKILVQLDGDRAPSVFDAITAYDAGVDVILQHGGIEPREVRDLVYGAMFTRGPADLQNSAVFIGGIDVRKGESMLQEATQAFFGPLRVSVMLDANGCNTTATAAVVKIITATPVEGRRVVVLAGTGPVGQRAAALFAKEGADVVLTSRTLDRAEAACAALESRFGVKPTPAAAGDLEATRRALDGAHAVLCTGVEGVSLVPEELWRGHDTLNVLGDVNAVPPLGVEGSKPTWDGKEVDGKKVFGALAIGDLKMKIHKRCIQSLFESNDQVLDVEEIEVIAKELV